MNDDQKPMSQVLEGTGWFKDISSNMAKRVLANAEKAGLPDDEVAAMRKRMRSWYMILKAYRDDMNEVKYDGKMDADFKRDMLVKMSDNLIDIRVSMFGE